MANAKLRNRSIKELINLQKLNVSILPILLLTIYVLISKVHSINLDEDGFYDIVIAVSEKTAQDGNDDYLENLKSGIQDFGDALWESTNGKFSIRSADILLPRHWEYVDEDGYATTQSFHTADIQISHEYLAPQAINPLFCGHPGQYIELPSSLFDVKDTGPYGPTGKALLALWARYRWGIHEEHGFPADPQFPYYWRERRLPEDPSDKEETWRVTNCANAEIKGSYLTLDGQPCDPDHGDTMYPPPSDCRFYPEIIGQEATTSLMSFPFIQSLLNFCDTDTHDKRAPTRQNHFCGYKSGWEVIQQSPDWLTLKEDSATERTRIQFRTLKKTTRPLLFILTEGANKPPEEVISGVATGLRDIFSQTYNWNVPAGVGVFPGLQLMDSYDVIYPWSFPWYDGASGMISSFESGFESRDPGYRDFGAAIHQLGTYIKERHSSGAVILIVKYGSESGDPEQYFTTFEGEVLATILENNIRIFTLEGSDTQAMNSYRLKYLTEMTGGLHFGIEEGDPTENTARVAEMMSAIDQVIKSGVPVTNHKVVHKEVNWILGLAYERKAFRVEEADIKNIKFFLHQLTSSYGTPMTPPTFTEFPVGTPPMFQEHLNWDKDEFSMKSFVASLDEELNQPTDWEYEVSCGTFDNCYFLMVAIAEVDSSASQSFTDHDISISTFTSADADNSNPDLTLESVTNLKGTTFSVYAKLEKNGHPINSPNLVVQAHVQLFLRDFGDLLTLGGFATSTDLVDDGLGAPDMTGNDGIFSGNYIPPIEMAMGPETEIPYQIFVTARLGPGPPLTGRVTESSKFSTSPVYRLITRCGSGWGGCWSETVTEPFTVYANLQRRIQFKGAQDYIFDDLGSVNRIIDLRVEPKLDGGDANRYNLVWTEPFIQKQTRSEDPGKFQADEYQIFYTTNFNHISEPENNQFLSEIMGPHYAGRQGSVRTFEIPDPIMPGTRYYYVIRAWERDKTSGRDGLLSNVAFLEAADPYIVPTTPPPSTVTPPVTDTTTTRPTKPPQTTTVPSLTSSTISTTTSPTATTRRTTTPATTPSTPRILNTTTVTYETTTKSVKHWYQTTGAIVAFAVFSVLIVSLVGGGLAYYKFFRT